MVRYDQVVECAPDMGTVADLLPTLSFPGEKSKVEGSGVGIISGKVTEMENVYFLPRTSVSFSLSHVSFSLSQMSYQPNLAANERHKYFILGPHLWISAPTEPQDSEMDEL